MRLTILSARTAARVLLPILVVVGVVAGGAVKSHAATADLAYWYFKGSSSVQYGFNGDVPVPGDYNGDGKADIAVWRPSEGNWYVKGITTVQYGLPGDIPVPGDYNRDGKTDFGIFRPSNQTFYVKGIGSYDFSSVLGTSYTLQPLAASMSQGDQPCVYYINGTQGQLLCKDMQGGAGYDGPINYGLANDVPGSFHNIQTAGYQNFGVWRPSNGTWYIAHLNGIGSLLVVQWGQDGDIPMPADFNGDGRTDLALWRPSTGIWYVKDALTGARLNPTTSWGLPGDIPVPADYNGDGKADQVVFRP